MPAAKKDIYAALAEIQATLKAPKGNDNKFGGYKYRNCEDILEAAKPLLNGASLTLSDAIEVHGNRVYVTATATLTLAGESVSTSASAREPENRKGMDEAQITGATSSYARKYALNGLLAIDNTADADQLNDSAEYTKPAPKRCLNGNQKLEILECCEAKGVDVNAILAAAKVSSLDEIEAARFDGLIKWINSQEQAA